MKQYEQNDLSKKPSSDDDSEDTENEAQRCDDESFTYYFEDNEDDDTDNECIGHEDKVNNSSSTSVQASSNPRQTTTSSSNTKSSTSSRSNKDDAKEADYAVTDKKTQYEIKVECAHQYLNGLVGKTHSTDSWKTKSNKKTKWTVVDDHVAPDNNEVRSKAQLGLRNEDTLKKITESEFPLADMHFTLMWKDGDWRQAMSRMNIAINEHNKEARRINPRYRKVKSFSPKEFLTCHGLFIGSAAVLERGTNLWPERSTLTDEDDPWNSIVKVTDFGQYIPEYRFKHFKRFVPTMWECQMLKARNDPWWRFAGAVREFNEIRMKEILTSTSRILDESMSAYRPRTTRLGGLPNISYIRRKPEPLGTEFKCCVCPLTNLMTHLEIQRGKDGMKNQSYHKELGATAACAKRITERVSQSHIDGNIETVKGDSWFGSVKAVVEICNVDENTAFRNAVFQVKTNKKGFPKKFIEDKLSGLPGGSKIVLKGKDPEHGVPLVAVGYKYNGTKILHFIFNEPAGSTTDGSPYIMKFPDEHGNVVSRDITRPVIIGDFFSQSNCVDVHNQLRQYGLHLEKKWITNQPYLRLHTTLVSIITVDTYHLSHFHSIMQKHKATGMCRLRNIDDTGPSTEYNPDVYGEYCPIDMSNVITMKNFAGVLCNQIIKYVDKQVLTSVLRASDSISRVANETSQQSSQETMFSSQSSSVLCIETSSEEGEDSNNQGTIGGLQEVLDEVYDCNGKVHQAVRVRKTGVRGETETVVMRCVNSKKLRFDGSKCPATRTRIICLQCNIPLCYPIRTKSEIFKNNYCFVKHVASIKKTRGSSGRKYINLTGLKTP